MPSCQEDLMQYESRVIMIFITVFIFSVWLLYYIIVAFVTRVFFFNVIAWSHKRSKNYILFT